MADILTDCLIQKILSFLSYQEATRMSILSKTWLRAWFDHPNLEFIINCLGDNINTVNTIMERYRKGKIPIEKFELLEPYVDSDEVFLLIDKWLDIALQNGVKDVFLNLTSYPVPILTILAAKSLRELILRGSNLLPVSLSSGVVNCNSLRKLSLSYLRLDENMVQTLLSSCPLIVCFILQCCSGKLQKIKSDSLKVLKIHHHCGIGEIDAPNLVSLDYMGNQIPELKIAKESSQLENSKIILECVNNLNIAWFCKLRKFLSNSSSWSQVTLYFFNCSAINMTDLQMNHIGSIPQVDILNVNILWKNQTIECPTYVDALLWSCHPRRFNLLSNIGTITHFIDRLMFIKNSSHPTSHRSAPWYSQLKDIKAFDEKNQSSQLRSGELTKRTVKDGEEKVYFLLDCEINMKDLQMDHMAFTPRVDVLNVFLVNRPLDCPAFVDALRCCCHPTRLNLDSNIKTFTH